MNNLDITPGSGAAQTRTHEDGGVHTQIVKIALGLTEADETIIEAGQQTSANSIPVVLPSDTLEDCDFMTAIDLASASITGSFVAIGTFDAGCKIIKLVNTTSVILRFAIGQNTNINVRLFPYSKETVDLHPSGLRTAATVYVQYDTVSPGSGNGVASIEAYK
jgi:hypothetical protein